MSYDAAFKANTNLIGALGEGNAHLVWSLGLYLEEPDLSALASEALTDGPDDKKIDFIRLDQDAKKIVFAQGYVSKVKKDTAPANKASDLNTAAAWLISGEIDTVPKQLKDVLKACRDALADGEVESIELLYVHNLPESVNVARELQTAVAHLKKALGDESSVTVTSRELGSSTLEHLFATQDSHIEVKEDVLCPSQIAFKESGPTWEASILSVPAKWLHELFAKHGDSLFSANYRGFLGISRRRKINTAIRQSAEGNPKNFWAFNNGITILTMGTLPSKDGTKLTGISIINGAQTTGSIGSVDLVKHSLADVKILCRVIQCTDAETINDIVRYNNTQNEITTWDQYSNDQEQNRIAIEFADLGHTYARKRGFRPKGDQIGIEDVAQPLLAFHGKFRDAVRGKNMTFERKPLYNSAFEGKKARHILFVYALSRAVDARRIELKTKSTNGTIIGAEDAQLALVRNLRFKSFFIAVMALVLESIIGKKVDRDTVSFAPAAASFSANSLVALVALWLPVVEAVLTFVTTRIGAADFAVKLGQDDVVETTAKDVAAFLYAARANLPFKEFSGAVADS